MIIKRIKMWIVTIEDPKICLWLLRTKKFACDYGGLKNLLVTIEDQKICLWLLTTLFGKINPKLVSFLYNSVVGLINAHPLLVFFILTLKAAWGWNWSVVIEKRNGKVLRKKIFLLFSSIRPHFNFCFMMSIRSK